MKKLGMLATFRREIQPALHKLKQSLQSSRDQKNRKKFATPFVFYPRPSNSRQPSFLTHVRLLSHLCRVPSHPARRARPLALLPGCSQGLGSPAGPKIQPRPAPPRWSQDGARPSPSPLPAAPAARGRSAAISAAHRLLRLM